MAKPFGHLDSLFIALKMNPTPHGEHFGNDAVTIAMTPACEDDTDWDVTGISAFGFHSGHYLELC